jgi:hypothetical protein
MQALWSMQFKSDFSLAKIRIAMVFNLQIDAQHHDSASVPCQRYRLKTSCRKI